VAAFSVAITTFIFFITYEWAQKARLFGPDKPFLSRIMKRLRLLGPPESAKKMKRFEYGPWPPLVLHLSLPSRVRSNSKPKTFQHFFEFKYLKAAFTRPILQCVLCPSSLIYLIKTFTNVSNNISSLVMCLQVIPEPIQVKHLSHSTLKASKFTNIR
jgi:hypothetical protein